MMDVYASNKSALDELYLRQNPCPNWMFAQIDKMNEWCAPSPRGPRPPAADHAARAPIAPRRHMRLPEEGEEYIADDDEPPMLDDGDDDEDDEKDEV